MLVYVIVGFVAGAWCGFLVGMLLWNEVVTRGVREDAEVDHDRALAARDAWRDMYRYAVEQRAATEVALRDHDRHSRKVSPLRSAS